MSLKLSSNNLLTFKKIVFTPFSYDLGLISSSRTYIPKDNIKLNNILMHGVMRFWVPSNFHVLCIKFKHENTKPVITWWPLLPYTCTLLDKSIHRMLRVLLLLLLLLLLRFTSSHFPLLHCCHSSSIHSLVTRDRRLCT